MKEKPNISNEVLKEILSLIDEGIHVVDTSGTTIFYNNVAARHDGMKVNEVLGKPLLSVFPSLNEQSSTLLKVLKTKKAIYNQHQTYTNIYGKKIETLNTTLPIFVDGSLAGAMEIAKDYSNVKSLTEQLIDLQKKLLEQKRRPHSENQLSFNLDHLWTVNPEMKQLKMEARKLSGSPSPILVFGESGTGKELLVQGIHHASPRKHFPFIAQNCAAIPESLLESILFGTAKGSYTGAIDRPGLFELADGGTLFLDELHAMPLDLQAKLLRAIEEGFVRRVGSAKNVPVNVRIIAAMNVHPKEALKEKKLRHDLFYRLNVFTFRLIPLRERKEDILFLANKFICSYNEKLKKNIAGLSKEVEQFFLSYSWPGNVRELKHTIEYMVNICEGERLAIEDLPLLMREAFSRKAPPNSKQSLRDQVEKYEKELIKNALDAVSWNVKAAAAKLKIPRTSLQYKIKKYNLSNAE